MNFGKDAKIVGFSTEHGITGTSRCGACGASTPPSGVCRRCAVYLIDVALSSASDEFPRLVPDTPDDRSMPETAGITAFDHYEICTNADGALWELGRGSMGITYKAIDTRLGRPAALKVINSRHLAGQNAKTRFLREARIAGGLRHPNIASVFHLGLSDENCFYAMEFIEGETLEERVCRRGVFSCETALKITAQATHALKAAHAQKFIHRDIKPTNIMLVGDETASGDVEIQVKLIDFGLVKAMADPAPTAPDFVLQNYFAGTPEYASPEQVESGRADVRSDVYSLGRCLLFMLTGDPLLEIRTSAERLPCDVPLAFPTILPFANLPASIASLLQSMLSADPTLRPQTASLLLQKIERCLTEIRPERPLIGRTNGRDVRSFMRGRRAMVAVSGLAVAGTIFAALQFSPMKISSPSPTDVVEAKILYSEGQERVFKHTKGDNEQAIALYLKAIAKFPDYADAYAALCDAYFQNVCRFAAPKTQLDLAVTYAERAIALDPNSPKGFAVLGTVRSFQGRHWEALSIIHRALELNPAYAPAMGNFSRLWSTVGQPQLGLPWAIAAAQVNPSSTVAWGSAAEACVDLCADEQAEKYYRKSLEINPAWMSAHCGLLHIHLLNGDFDRAREDFQVARSIEPDLILPLSLKAQIELFSGDYSAAETIYRQLLTMQRNGLVNYYSGISYLSALGFLRRQAGALAESDSLLAEAATLHLSDSEGPQAVYDLAAIRAIEHHREEALSLLRQSITSGWMDYRATSLDPRFEFLREDTRFRALIADLKNHVEAMRQESEKLCSKKLVLADYPVRSPSK